MFEKICSAVTAFSTFVIAALCVWWTANVVKCSNDMTKAYPSASSEGSGVTPEAEMQAESERIARQLQERFVKSQQKIQDAASTLIPLEKAPPPVPSPPMKPLR